MTLVRIISARFPSGREADLARARLLEKVNLPEEAIRCHSDPHLSGVCLLQVRVPARDVAAVVANLEDNHARDLHEDTTEWPPPRQRWLSRHDDRDTGAGVVAGQGDSEAGDPS